jgi:hypothetical protein
MAQAPQLSPETGKRLWPVRKQEPRKKIPDFTTEHARLACEQLIAEGEENNSTKFSISYKGHLLAPKKVIIRAVYLATKGEVELHVREFSGGEESNKRLRKAGLEIVNRLIAGFFIIAGFIH